MKKTSVLLDVYHRAVSEPHLPEDRAVKLRECVDQTSHVVCGAGVEEPNHATLVTFVRGCAYSSLLIEEDVAAHAHRC